jgi:hypothetical protein
VVLLSLGVLVLLLDLRGGIPGWNAFFMLRAAKLPCSIAILDDVLCFGPFSVSVSRDGVA